MPSSGQTISILNQENALCTCLQFSPIELYQLRFPLPKLPNWCQIDKKANQLIIQITERISTPEEYSSFISVPWIPKHKDIYGEGSLF